MILSYRYTLQLNEIPKQYPKQIYVDRTSFFPYYFYPDTEEMVHLGTGTIKNFLSYLLLHEICPEYEGNIRCAQMSCDIASKELWQNQQFTVSAPGNFNTSCSILFGGYLYDTCVDGNTWKSPKLDDSGIITRDMALSITGSVLNAVASRSTDTEKGRQLRTRFSELSRRNAVASKVEDINGFEITEIFPVVTEIYLRGATRRIGKVIGKPYRDPAKAHVDLSPQERLQWEKRTLTGASPQFTFFLEESVYKHCYRGMKVIASVWEFGYGIHYFEEVVTAFGSIYTVLCNDLMLGWKKPGSLVPGEDETDEKQPEI